MSNVKKLMMTAAGGGGLNVEDVFSTYLYEGTGSANHTITTGVDIDGEGGVTWIKSRTNAEGHNIYYNDSGTSRYVKSTDNSGSVTPSDYSSTYGLQSWTSTGFNVGVNFAGENGSGTDYASWSFRKAPKFFDVVFYTGDGTTSKTVSHNLGTTPGAVFFKRVDASDNWTVWHRSISGGGYSYPYQRLNGNFPITSLGDYGNNLTPTSSVLRTPVHTNSGNTADSVNVSGASYVAFVFAHNDGDGDFGPTGDQDIIKCGSYTGNGSTDGPEIDLGFEPQFTIVKNITSTGNWMMHDNMRGVTTYATTGGGDDEVMYCNSTSAESAASWIDYNASGFKLTTTHAIANSSSQTYLYIAIRRGPMAVPTDATDVFDVQTGASPFTAGFPVDLGIQKNYTTTGNWWTINRLTGPTRYLKTNSTDAEATLADQVFDNMTEWGGSNWGTQSTGFSWRRAPTFFDVVAYKASSISTALNHNLGVPVEMAWIKSRTSTQAWNVLFYDQLLSGTFGSSSALSSLNSFYTSDATTFLSPVHATNRYYIAYLFASLDGISKVGTYTGNGTNQNIDCGFSNGARFVLVKAVSASSNWQVAGDFGNGIVAGSDSLLRLDLDNAQATFDFIDPYSAGFNVTGAQLNTNGTDYIFYAVA